MRRRTQADGILGMAFPALAAAGDPAFLTLLARYPGVARLFSFFLVRGGSKAATTAGGDGSEVIIGGVDMSHALTPGFEYVPLITPPQYWAITMTRFAVGDAVFCSDESPCAAVVRARRRGRECS